DSGIGVVDDVRLDQSDTGPQHRHGDHRTVETVSRGVLQGCLDLDFVEGHVGQRLCHQQVAETLGGLPELGRLGVPVAEDGEEVGCEGMIDDPEHVSAWYPGTDPGHASPRCLWTRPSTPWSERPEPAP